MADLRTTFAGIESPNPFWLASGPPTNTYGQVARAFDQGWGGAVWKTIGDPPLIEGPGYLAVRVGGRPGGQPEGVGAFDAREGRSQVHHSSLRCSHAKACARPSLSLRTGSAEPRLQPG